MAMMVLEIPEELKVLEGPLNALVGEARRRLDDAKRGRRIDYELFEQRVAERIAKMEATTHAVTLAALDIDAERILINDKAHVRVGRYAAPYRTQVRRERFRSRDRCIGLWASGTYRWSTW